MNVISVNNVTKKFRDIAALSNVSLNIEGSQIVGIIGRNGSGKTVLMKCICGFLTRTAGKFPFTRWTRERSKKSDNFPIIRGKI